jgi:hypothetical protein
MVGERYFETPSANPGYIYQNNLVALDADKGMASRSFMRPGSAPSLHSRARP